MSFLPKFKLATASPCATTWAPPVRTIYFPALADNVLPEFFLTLCPLPPFILADGGLEYSGNNPPFELYSSPEKLFLCVLIPDCPPCTDFRFNPMLPAKPLSGLPLFCWFCQFTHVFILREYYLFYRYSLRSTSPTSGRVFPGNSGAACKYSLVSYDLLVHHLWPSETMLP